jgi:NADH dehydrogenase [ubiquinone] 1 alpha subcomplex assembly factor 5
MSTPPLIFDPSLLNVRRNRAAPTADAHDFLLARVADDFADRLVAINRTFPVAADVGSHHGVLARRLAGLAGIEKVVSVDSAADLLARAPAPRVLADIEALPFADASLDLVVSALSLHFANDLPGTLLQIRRALRPDGLFLGALLGGETLAELRRAFLEAEAERDGGVSPRVAPFADVRELGALLQRAGFALPVADADTVTVTYADPLALVRELKAMGASNALRERRRTPLRRATFLRALELYAEQCSLPNGRVKATFEIVTLTGWVPHESQQKPLRPGSAAVRLADALGTVEQSAGEAVVPPKPRG